MAMSTDSGLIVPLGIRSCGEAELMELAVKSDCPVTSTLLGKGVFPEDHPLSLGMLGGAAVVAAPVFNVVKVPNASVDPGIALTVTGASVAALSVLWIQVSQVGKISNDTFQKSTDLTKLIQESEVRWQTQVCHAETPKLARIQASNLLKALAGQCVKTVPKVKVNPDIFKQINQQQDNISSTLRKYNALQQQMERREARNQSRSKLKRLSNAIEQLQHSTHTMGGPRLHQQLNALESLCVQARSEYKRLQALRSSTAANVGGGSWEGICSSLEIRRQRIQKSSIVHKLRQSQTRLQTLVQRITLLQKKLVQEDRQKAGPRRKRLERRQLLACFQARTEHKRLQALQTQWNTNTKPLPPGSWAGSCRLLEQQRKGKQ